MRSILVGYREHALPKHARTDPERGFRPGATFALTDTAARVHASRARVRVIRGGLGSAKTHTLAMAAMFLLFRNLGHRGLVVEPDYPLLRDVWRPRFEACLEEAGFVEGIDWTFNKNDQTYHVLGGFQHGGASVLLKSGGAYHKIVGFEAAWAVLDEPAEMPREAIERVLMRVRLGESRIVIGGTPDPGSWFSDWLKKPPVECEVFQAKTLENPYAPQHYIDGLLEQLDPETARAMLDGEIVTLGGGAYSSFVEEPHPAGNIAEDGYDPDRPLFIACDNNRDPLVAVLVQEYGRRLHVFGEVMIYSGSWSELAERIAARLDGEAPPGITLAGDADLRGRVVNERTDWGAYLDLEQELRRVLGPGWRSMLAVPKANPMVVNRLSSINAEFCNARGERSLTIHPDCVELIRDCNEMERDSDGQLIKPGTTKGRKVGKERSHLSDALGYLVAEKRPRKKKRRLYALVAKGPKRSD